MKKCIKCGKKKNKIYMKTKHLCSLLVLKSFKFHAYKCRIIIIKIEENKPVD